MKKSLYQAVCLSAVLAVTACSDDDDNKKPSEDNKPNEVVDTTSPVIGDVQPANDTYLSEASAQISGTINEENLASVAVMLNGTTHDASIEGNAFNVEVPLQEGNNTFVVTAVDDAGNQGTYEGVIIADTTLPVFSDVLPEQSDFQNSESVELTGTLTEENPDTLTVEVNGETYTGSVDGSAFTAQITVVEGVNTYTITSEDAAGNKATYEGSIALDTKEPVLAGLYPVNERDVDSRLPVISGTIDEANIEQVTITSGDQSVVANVQDGRWAARLQALAGANEYKVVAVDKAGNESEQQGSFYLGQRAAAGGAHTSVIKGQYTYVWGRNNLGQLGLGTVTTMAGNPDTHPVTPKLLDTGTTFVSLAFNQNASLAIDDGGNVWAWGDGDDGQLGLGASDDDVVDETDYSTPQKIPGLSEIVSVVRGYDHSMVLTASGDVYTFGDNRGGQLGDGTDNDRDYAAKVDLPEIVQISGASQTSYALDADGNIWAWGRNKYGNLGLSNDTEDETNFSPVEVPIDAAVTAIAAGRDHILALTDKGQVYAWGLNASSQVGLRESEQWEQYILSPTLLPWFSDAVAVQANGNQSYVERRDGKIYPWGQNMLGTLGTEADGNVEEPSSPIFGMENVRSFVPGPLHGVAMRSDGNAFAWGWSFEGSLGGGESTIAFWGYRVPILLSLPEPAEAAE